MKTINHLTSACRHCRYYQPEGRRGGMCQMLGAPVQGSWKACALAIPTFAPAWEGIEGMMILSETPAVLASSSIASALDVDQLNSCESEVGYTQVQGKEEPLLV